MTAILLNSGRRVDPFNLDAEFLSIAELMKPLPKLCRYSGQPDCHYSVAEHTVHLINVVPAGLKRAVALHDMNEGLTNDLPHPFKAALPDFVEFEQMVQRQIFAWYGEPWENMALINDYDRRICADEMAQIFTPPHIIQGMQPLGVKVEGWEWREAEQKLSNALKFVGLL
ncbi:hypothetical protein ACCS91_33585 [Rhizobium ruizarguesonis]|uniref:hypothetical protein n=1 Tax=Rhizobium ruizarguesonis TaxID=2081791 RepID=UPI0016396177|nr:hypothetical protein [Rhizobium ruizarguesonis]MBC2806632.1 hypothetical protein [Rhizobium ruizarguesonis]